MRTTSVRRVLGESGIEARQVSNHGSALRRVLGEEVHGEEADFHPTQSTHEEPSAPPVPNDPDDGNYNSMADLDQHKGDVGMDQSGESGALSTALSMWRSGSKYDTADYLLKSDVPYAEFVRLIRMLPDEEAIELGTILDELAPPGENGDKPNDLVSAVAGGGDEIPTGVPTETP